MSMSRALLVSAGAGSINKGLPVKSNSSHNSQTLAFSSCLVSAVSQQKQYSRYCVGLGRSLPYDLHSHQRIKQRNFVVYSNIPGVPLPSEPPSSGSWKGWVVGILLTVVLPFFTHKWGPLLRIKSQIDSAVQSVEDVVEAVEHVAEKIDKVAEHFADDLPEGSLKNAVRFVEHTAERVAKDADTIDNFIDKAQEMEEKVEEFVESTVAEKAKKAEEGKEATDEKEQ